MIKKIAEDIYICEKCGMPFSGENAEKLSKVCEESNNSFLGRDQFPLDSSGQSEIAATRTIAAPYDLRSPVLEELSKEIDEKLN